MILRQADLLSQAPWTIGATLLMVFLNLGLFPWAPAASHQLIELLQYDRAAILDGQIWRLVSGNLVHWSPEHFFLDVGVFLVVGLLYERLLRPIYPWLLAGMALALGLCLLAFQPDLVTYRGLSGVDSGQFAAVLAVELMLARQVPWRWLWVLPAALVFALKIGFEFLTGRMFFGTEALGDIGVPVPLVHVAGAILALVPFLAIRIDWSFLVLVRHRPTDRALRRRTCSLPSRARPGCPMCCSTPRFRSTLPKPGSWPSRSCQRR